LSSNDWGNSSSNNGSSGNDDDDDSRTDDTVHVSQDGSCVLVRFDNNNGTEKQQEQQSIFHGPWLWSNDPNIVHPSSGQRTRSPISYFTGWRIQSAKIALSDNTTIAAKPPPRGSLHSIGGVYDDDDSKTTERNMLHVIWTKKDGDNNKHTENEYAETAESFYDLDWLWRCRYDDNAMTLRQQETRFIAYTSVALCPHQSYYESPPGLQLLHYIQNQGVIGGESILIDALAAAKELCHLAPDLFNVIVRCEATFLKQRRGAHMAYRCPHIQLNGFPQLNPTAISSNRNQDNSFDPFSGDDDVDALFQFESKPTNCTEAKDSTG
jgi:hypothetical protein